MTLPNFLVIGAMKAGTTSLHQYLAAHPQVFMSRNKELHFFAEGVADALGWDCGWEKGRDWYEEQFAEAGGALAIGESSPSYTAYPLRLGVPSRIAETIPHARLIYLLRHPVDRIKSEYVHKRLNGRERRPIGTALLDDPTYVDKSRYAAQIEQFLDWFPRDQLLVLLSEDLRHDRAATMRRAWDFLGVDPSVESHVLETEFHRNVDKSPVSAAARLAQRTPGYSLVSRRSSPRLKQAYLRLTRARQDPRQVTIPEPVRWEIEARLAPDLDRLRELVPGALDKWHGIGESSGAQRPLLP